MLPIMLDVKTLNLALIVGAGDEGQAVRRLAMLDAAGATSVQVYAQNADEALVREAGARLINHIPPPKDFAKELADTHIVYIADMAEAEAAPLVAVAKKAKALVNLEDNKPYCDFHVPAMVRRGDLLLTISTNGKSPALARRIKSDLGAHYPEAWAERLNTLATSRTKWREAGASLSELSTRTNNLIDEKGWL